MGRVAVRACPPLASRVTSLASSPVPVATRVLPCPALSPYPMGVGLDINTLGSLKIPYTACNRPSPDKSTGTYNDIA